MLLLFGTAAAVEFARRDDTVLRRGTRSGAGARSDADLEHGKIAQTIVLFHDSVSPRPMIEPAYNIVN